jgi:hypothetical protein
MLKLGQFLEEVKSKLEKKAFIPNPDVMKDQLQAMYQQIQQSSQGLPLQVQQALQQQIQQVQQMPPVDQMQTMTQILSQVKEQAPQSGGTNLPSNLQQSGPIQANAPVPQPVASQGAAQEAMPNSQPNNTVLGQGPSQVAKQANDPSQQIDPAMLQQLQAQQTGSLQDLSQLQDAQQQSHGTFTSDLANTKVTVSVPELLDLVSGGKQTATKLKLQELMMKSKHKTDMMQDTHEQEKNQKAQELQIKQQEQQTKLQQQQQAQQAQQQGMMGGGVYGQPMDGSGM